MCKGSACIRLLNVEKPTVHMVRYYNVLAIDGNHLAGKFKVPKIVSFPLGEAQGTKGIQVEMHYDNPLLLKGRTDASGLRFHLTKTPRQHEVKCMLPEFPIIVLEQYYTQSSSEFFGCMSVVLLCESCSM